MNIFSITALTFLLSITHLVFAGEPSRLFGKWKFQAPAANIVWEFTASTITFTPFDLSGKPLAEPNKANISYINLTDTSWGIDFKTTDGRPGGGFMAIMKDENNVVLDFPGAGGQTLTREK